MLSLYKNKQIEKFPNLRVPPKHNCSRRKRNDNSNWEERALKWEKYASTFF